MIDVLTITVMAACGVAALAPFWRTLGWGLLGVALPFGAAVYVGVGLVMLALGVPFSTAGALIGAAAIGLLAVGFGLHAGMVERSSVAVATVGATLAAAAGVAALHLSRFTVDSIRVLLIADVLETTGSLDVAGTFDIRMRQLVTPLLHTPGVADGAGYSATVTPLFALSGLMAAGWLAHRLLARSRIHPSTRWVLIGAMGLLLVTTNRFLFHAAYINGHMFFAVFLLLGAGFATLLVVEDEPAWLVIAAAGFAALVPLRPDAGITAALFLVPFLVETRLRPGRRWLLLMPLLMTAVLWNGVVWPTRAAPSDLDWFGPVRANLVVGAALAGGLAVVIWTPVRRFARWGPGVAFGTLLVALAVATAREPELMRSSLAAVGANVAVEGLFGALWWALPPLAATAWVITRPGNPARLLLVPLPAYAAALLLFAALRGSAYRTGTGDSGSRMLLHAVLVTAVAIVAAATGDDLDDAAATRKPASAEPSGAPSSIAAG